MKIGIVKEIKDSEARVGMTPEGVRQLVGRGHTVVVEFDAGIGSGFSNDEYEQAGAMLADAPIVWETDLVIKVKEPQPVEYVFFNGQILFTFLHLAGVLKSLTDALLDKQMTALAYEALENERGQLPILQPMSAVAGNMSVLMGSYYLARFNHGSGVQLGSVLSHSYGHVLIIGDGVVGQHATQVATAMGANVTVAGLNKSDWVKHYEKEFTGFSFVESTQKRIADLVRTADVVIGAVLCRGAKAPKVVTEAMLKTMRPGSVLVDVSIDQGGCFETSVPTTHSNPVFIKQGVTHYCVANMPGAYPRTSTYALTEATLPYIVELAERGITRFITHKGNKKSLMTYQGRLLSEQVAEALGIRLN